MKVRPFISFVIPFYNRFDLLKEAILSVLSSDFSDLEIILVDDVSDGNALRELSDIMNGRSNILYIRQPENRGPGAARNRGIRAAKGEWIFFLDCDDIIYGDALPKLAAFLKSARDTDIAVFTETMFRYPDGGLKKIRVPGGKNETAFLDHLFNWYHSVYNMSALWNYCFRRSFIMNNCIKCPETYHLEDISMSITAVCRAKKMALFTRCFYEYRVGSPLSLDALGREGDTEHEKRITGRKLFFSRLAQLCEEDIPPDRKRRLEHLLRRCIFYSLWEPEAYKQNKYVCSALDAMREKIAACTWNWQKKVYISPCFFEAAATARLIIEWGGGGYWALSIAIKHPRGAACAKKTAV